MKVETADRMQRPGGEPGPARAAAARADSGRPVSSGAGRAGGWVLSLIRTGDRRIDLVVRATLGIVMLPHGAQKLLGWFGGPGFSGAMGHLTGDYGLPWLVAVAVILIESLGAFALVLGAFGRVAAGGVAAVMVGAIFTSHLEFGFFMNWFGAQAGEGFEYHLLALGLSASVLVNGSGALSFDRLWTKEAVR